MKNFVKSSWTVTSCLPGTLLLALIFCSQASWIEAQSLCTAGMAGGFPCSNVDLLARVKMSTLGGTRGSDIWGWTDPTTGTEYAIMGFKQGTSFVDISTPTAPFVVGTLPPHSDPRQARDIKVYSDHAFIVSDTSDHGMQVFDLTQLRTATPRRSRIRHTTTGSGTPTTSPSTKTPASPMRWERRRVPAGCT